MKALEILKWLSTNEALSCAFHKEALEAIAELEAMEQPKTCNLCSKYGHNFGNGYDKDYCTKLDQFTNDNFGCIFYEPKQPTGSKQ